MTSLFEIKHRYSNADLFSLETESLKVCAQEAVRLSADLRGADFEGANLEGVNLEGANLRGANFEGANFEWADLRDADLRGASFKGANLDGAEGIIHMGAPNGYHAHAWLRDGWLSIRVGCHEFRLPEARAYWAGKDHRREALAALDYAEAVVTIRGWALVAPAKQEAA